jgi:purine-nucleoside phosphorylase
MQKIKENIKAAADYIHRTIKQTTEIGMLLGSGMAAITQYIKQPIIIPYDDIPFFPRVKKRSDGKIIFCEWQEKKALIFIDRLHFYQGYSYRDITYPIWLIKELNASLLISVNTSGALNKSFSVGDVMVVRDHINLMGNNPLLAIPFEERNPQFLDLSSAYDSNLISICHKAAKAINMPLKEGVLAALTGPCYETPAEVRMLQRAGADAACMSSIPEVIMANYCNIKVLALSLIANKAADHGNDKITHQSVLKAAGQFQHKIYNLLTKLFTMI